MVGLASCCCLCFFAQGVLEIPMRMVQSQTFTLFKYSNISVLGSRETPGVWVTKATETKRNKDGDTGENLHKGPLCSTGLTGLSHFGGVAGMRLNHRERHTIQGAPVRDRGEWRRRNDLCVA